MPKLRTPLEVYKLLPKSNCGLCRSSTCMAFSAAVVKREKRLADCPHLDKRTVGRYDGKIERQINLERIQEESLLALRREIALMNLSSRAERLGARCNGETLVVKCLGKDFEIDAQGAVISQCHTHAWFSIPLLNYVLFSKGEDIAGRWVPFRELENGRA